MKRYVILLLCITIILTACQPTPKEQIVIKRDNFENLVANTPEVTITSEPNEESDDLLTHITWQDESQKTTKTPRGEFTTKTYITVDDSVDLSQKKAPVYLVEPTKFDLPFAKNAVDCFFEGEYYDSTRTKDDYLMQILLLEPIVPNIIKKWRSSTEDDLAEIKRKYKDATDSNKKVDIAFDYGHDEILCAKGYPYKNAVSELFVKNGGMSDTVMYYCVDDMDRYYGETKYEYSGVPALGMTTSYEDAKRLVAKAVNKLYGNEMACVQTTLANRGRLNEIWHSIGSCKIGSEEFGSMDQGYVFYFTRTYNGVPQLYAPLASNENNLENGYGGYVYERSWDYEYSMKWPAEYVMVTVDDTGIVEFWGFSPAKKAEIVNENVAMLPFDKFKQNIYFNSVWSDADTKVLNINITNVRFGMIRVPKKDESNVYYMVPAWQFAGNKSADTYSGYQEETGKTFMVLNAIDGSIVDTSYYENTRLDNIKYIGEDHIYINHMDFIPPPTN